MRTTDNLEAGASHSVSTYINADFVEDIPRKHICFIWLGLVYKSAGSEVGFDRVFHLCQ